MASEFQKKPETEEKALIFSKTRADESSDEQEPETPMKAHSASSSARTIRERPEPILFTAETMAMKLPGNARVIRPLPSSLSIKHLQKKGLISWDGKG